MYSWLLTELYKYIMKIDEKFIEQIGIVDWEIETDAGFVSVDNIYKTIPYIKFCIKTENGCELICADDHIVFDNRYCEIFVKDIVENSTIIQTKFGISKVISKTQLEESANMYDISVESDLHRYYTNDILSHNTTTTTAFLLWSVLFKSNHVAAILANKAATAREILGKLQLSYENLPLYIQQGVLEWNKGSMTLENGSKVIASATSKSAIRGFSINTCLLDEFAFVPRNIADEFMTAIYPTISSGKTTKMIIISTPNSMNHFYKLWKDAEENRNLYKRIKSIWSDVPGRDDEWKENEIKQIGQDRFAQEYCCEFMGSVKTLISSTILSEFVWKNPISIEDCLKIYKNPEEGHSYIACVDVSEGLGQDSSIVCVIDVSTNPYEVVAIYKNAEISPVDFPIIIQNISRRYNSAFILVEGNGIGMGVLNSLQYELEEENLIYTNSTKRGYEIYFGAGRKYVPGVKMTSSVKRSGCSNLKYLVENKLIDIKDYDTFEEFANFVNKSGSYGAEEGNHDDLVMSLVLFAWLENHKEFRDFKKDLQNNEESFDNNLPMGCLVTAGEGQQNFDEFDTDLYEQDFELLKK